MQSVPWKNLVRADWQFRTIWALKTHIDAYYDSSIQMDNTYSSGMKLSYVYRMLPERNIRSGHGRILVTQLSITIIIHGFL